MSNENSEVESLLGGNSAEVPEQMEGGNEHPEMNGGKRKRKTKGRKNGKKSGRKSAKKSKKSNKRGGTKKSLNGLASVGALFAAQQVFARKSRRTAKKLSKRGKSKK